MIFYFSGTGNSRYVAEELGRIIRENVFSITADNVPSDVPTGDSIGFVFPVYSWGVPPNVITFIQNLTEGFRNAVNVNHIPVWCVMTCGDEVARAPEMFRKCLADCGMEVESIWSVIMPNNYVILPGFDTDPKDVEAKKLEACGSRIKEIAQGLIQHRRVCDVTVGSMPGLKTRLVYPLFKRWGIFPKKWHYTSFCVGCGICARECPYGNVTMSDGFPKWGDNCCSCLACYHSCPRHAVAYGNATAKKGQYWFAKAMRKFKTPSHKK